MILPLLTTKRFTLNEFYDALRFARGHELVAFRNWVPPNSIGFNAADHELRSRSPRARRRAA